MVKIQSAQTVRPAGKPKGAVVVLQEIFGVNSHIRNVADGYAQAGYLAVAPAVFHRLKQDVDLGYGPEDRESGIALKGAVEAMSSLSGDASEAPVMRDIAAAISYASEAAGLTAPSQGARVGMVGYCWGGLLTWRAACLLSGLDAAVCYYGGGVTTPREIARLPRCPVMAHFADQDKHISLDSVNAFGSAHPEVELHVYSADHGFNCDHRESHDAAAASLARERTLTFFARHLE
jgi:carboxymethylenebutenolidase